MAAAAEETQPQSLLHSRYAAPESSTKQTSAHIHPHTNNIINTNTLGNRQTHPPPSLAQEFLDFSLSALTSILLAVFFEFDGSDCGPESYAIQPSTAEHRVSHGAVLDDDDDEDEYSEADTFQFPNSRREVAYLRVQLFYAWLVRLWENTVVDPFESTLVIWNDFCVVLVIFWLAADVYWMRFVRVHKRFRFDIEGTEEKSSKNLHVIGSTNIDSSASLLPGQISSTIFNTIDHRNNFLDKPSSAFSDSSSKPKSLSIVFLAGNNALSVSSVCSKIVRSFGPSSDFASEFGRLAVRVAAVVSPCIDGTADIIRLAFKGSQVPLVVYMDSKSAGWGSKVLQGLNMDADFGLIMDTAHTANFDENMISRVISMYIKEGTKNTIGFFADPNDFQNKSKSVETFCNNFSGWVKFPLRKKHTAIVFGRTRSLWQVACDMDKR
ncbi:hypothetical protein HK100_008924, partial [Physocladia obscura]